MAAAEAAAYLGHGHRGRHGPKCMPAQMGQRDEPAHPWALGELSWPGFGSVDGDGGTFRSLV